jgi:hypothetical protein
MAHLRPRGEALEPRWLLAITYTVQSTADDGSANTLRWAINQVNFDATDSATSPDTINFNIPIPPAGDPTYNPATGVWTISPSSVLPSVNRPAIIDATTQSGYHFLHPVIELNGTGAGSAAPGLLLLAGNSTVQGLVINRFSASGIEIITNGGNAIHECVIGADPTSNTAEANGGDGVFILGGSSANHVFENTISGNNGYGVEIVGIETNNNEVARNAIGLDSGLGHKVPNVKAGVAITTGAQDNPIHNNEIGGNGGDGILISGQGTNGNQLQSNDIGVSLEWTVGNSGAGVHIADGASANGVGAAQTPLTGPGGGIASSINHIGANGGDGVLIEGAGTSGNMIQGNAIGGPQIGAPDNVGNGDDGVLIRDQATGNTIGGASTVSSAWGLVGLGNVISRNVNSGVAIDHASGNFVQGNFIGTDSTGKNPLPNVHVDGVDLVDGATANTIGGASSVDFNGNLAGLGNLISGSPTDGVAILHSSANMVYGNFIGVDVTGKVALPNGWGVALDDGATGNTIGGASSVDFSGNLNGLGNVISGNRNDGVFIGDIFSTSPVTGNVVEDNYIGTDVSGTQKKANQQYGVLLDSGATGNTIGAGNVVSGNGLSGVVLQGATTTANTVEGNLIGTDATGSQLLGNGFSGVYLWFGAHDNLIGTNADGFNDAGERNVISGNAQAGVTFDRLGTAGNTVAGNFIGTNAAGTAPLPNLVGVDWFNGAAENTIGGAAPSAGNVISGNTEDGIDIQGNGLPDGVVADYQAEGNANDALGLQNGTIAGNVTFEPGPSSGQGLFGQAFHFDGAAGEGVSIPPSPSLDVGTGGGFTVAAWINPDGVPSEQPIVEFSNGVNFFANVTFGGAVGPWNLYANLRVGATDHIVSSPRNIIQPHVWQFVVLTYDKSSGLATLYVNNSQVAQQNFGPITPITNTDLNIGHRQPFSFNGVGQFTGGIDEVGIYNRALNLSEIDGLSYQNGEGMNNVYGNRIGTALDPATKLANGGDGIVISNSFFNQVGNPFGGAPNVIAGNTGRGVYITGSASWLNSVDGNSIGTDVTGTVQQGNGSDGVRISEGAYDNQVGGAGGANVIAYNHASGVVVGNSPGDGATGNDLEDDRIYGNARLGIDLGNDGVTPNAPAPVLGDANNLVNSPVITFAQSSGGMTFVQAMLHNFPNSTIDFVDFYVDSNPDPNGHGQGETLLGRTPSIHTDPNGNFNIADSFPTNLLGKYITATMTDNLGDTSEFALNIQVTPLVATLSSLGSASVAEGTTTLTVNGFFVNGAAVLLNGTLLATTFVSATQLQATLPAGLEEGATYGVAVANPSPGGGISSALPLTVTEAPLTATGLTLTPTEAGVVDGVVATFTDAGTAEAAANYTALVDWGDGNSSTGTVVAAGAGFNVVGSHTYLEEGSHTVSVNIDDDGGSTATATSTANIADAGLAPVLRPRTATIGFIEGQPATSTVATFEDPDPRAAAGDFIATINWGDGSPSSPGTIAAASAGGNAPVFSITGSHTYPEEGASLPVTITISDGTGNTATATATASVGLPATSMSLTVTGNKKFNGDLATFNDAGLSPAVDFTASINWGDGATSAGTVTTTSIGNYKVSGSHQFAAFNGAKAITITIVDADSAVSTVVSDPIIDPPVGTQAATPNQNYVAAAYLDLFGQGGDNSTTVAGTSLAAWAGQLDAGASRVQFATALVHSADYYASIIRPIYERYLGREPDTAGLSYWVSQMQAGLTDERLEAGFIGSAEFYTHAGGTDKLWVDFMYLDLLGRAADSAGESYWVDQLAAGADRSSVAYGFAASLERERQRVQDDYFRYLGRQADSAGVDYWVAAFAQGTTNEDVIAGFIASDEYFKGHT